MYKLRKRGPGEHTMHMKKMKRTLPVLMAAALATASLPLAVQADSSNVVTLGANLSEEQKTSMYEYFGTSKDQVQTIEVTNADERQYMEGIASEEQIGTRTYSCSYVQPTSDGGIQVKVANLTYVTSSMIASTLTTSGVENCNVVAASPIAVSGTGALTGIMMAYETASGETLDEGQKAAATEELVTTGELADAVGQEEATGLMNDVKEQVIEDGITDPSQIQDVVNDAANTYNITLTEDQMNKITSLMETISQYDYDVNALKNTLDNLNGESGGFFSNLWDSITGFFGGGDSNGGIINDTNDDVLGSDVVTDSTLEDSGSSDSSSDSTEEEGGGFWDSIVGFFQNLFGGGDDTKDETTDESAEETTDETTDPAADETTDETLDENSENTDGAETENTDENADGTTEADGTDSLAADENADGTVSNTDNAGTANDPAAAETQNN